MRILHLDPFHGGSHAAVADGLARHSRHEIRVISLPARAWKWRMRGAAIWFAERLREREGELDGTSLILSTDMLSAADLRALLPARLAGCPLVIYFHENQLTYPDRQGDPRDLHFAFTNLTSALAADQVWFNSAFHRRSFLVALKDLLERMPDAVPGRAVETIAARARIMPPGIETTASEGAGARDSAAAPLILWNHRWEHDKNPAACFEALAAVKRRGGRFRLAVAGQSFRAQPAVFDTVPERFADELEQFGELDEAPYRQLLLDADVVLSTAHHEFLGLAVLEAIAAGAYPLLPARLSYPELIPAEYRDAHLYGDDGALVERLVELLDRHPFPRPRSLQRRVVETYGWPARAAAFDAAFEEVVAAAAHRP